MVNYTVNDLCNSGILVSPIQVRTATNSLSNERITEVLGYNYEGEFVRSTTIGNTGTSTNDRKLWLIGAILGPIAFVLLFIFVICYLHYKCRPRPKNRPSARVYSVIDFENIITACFFSSSSLFTIYQNHQLDQGYAS